MLPSTSHQVRFEALCVGGELLQHVCTVCNGRAPSSGGVASSTSTTEPSRRLSSSKQHHMHLEGSGSHTSLKRSTKRTFRRSASAASC